MVESTLLEATIDGTPIDAAALLAAAGDPHRLRILRTLSSGAACVCDLQTQVPLAPNLLSYHLRVLREAGLIVGTRRGRWVDYALAEGALDRLHASIPQVGPESATGEAGCVVDRSECAQ